MKLVLLLCLLSGHRNQSLSSIDVRNIHFSHDKVIIYIGEVMKTTRPGSHNGVIQLRRYPDNELCVVHTLEVYMTKTFVLRGPKVGLLVALSEPHQPVTVGTIRRWVTDGLGKAGIDLTIFGSHSTRSASTSSAEAQPVVPLFAEAT